MERVLKAADDGMAERIIAEELKKTPYNIKTVFSTPVSPPPPPKVLSWIYQAIQEAIQVLKHGQAFEFLDDECYSESYPKFWIRCKCGSIQLYASNKNPSHHD